MKSATEKLIILFVLGIGITSILFSRELLDFTLVPRFIGLALGLTVVFLFLYKKKYDYKFELTSLTFVYLAYTFLVCLSIVWSNTKSEAYFESSKQVLFFLCFITTLLSINQNENLFNKWITRVSYVLFLIILLVFSFQYILISNSDKEALYNVTGINGHKNLVSSFLFLNLFFLIRGAFNSKGVSRILFFILVFSSLIILALLKTKAVWLGLLLTIAVFISLWLYTKITKKSMSSKGILIGITISICILNVFFLFILKPILHHSIQYSNDIKNPSSLQNQAVKLESERLILWDKTLEMIKDAPILGVGIGNWQINFPNATLTHLWRAEDLNYTFQRPHNDFLWILSETGLIGFNLFLVFLLLLLCYTLRLIQLNSHDFKKQKELLLRISFILGFYFISFFDFPKERIEHSIWINVMLGMLVFSIQKETTLPFNWKIRMNKIFFLTCGIFTLFLTYLGILRFKGEYYTRQLFNFKNANQKFEVLKCGDKILNRMYSIDPTTVPIQWYTGNAQAALGNYEKAKSDFIQSYALTPFNRNVLNDLASAYAMSGDIVMAKKYYEEAARISPRFDEPKLNLAALYLQEKNFVMAAFWLKSLLHDSERRTEYEKFIKLNAVN